MKKENIFKRMIKGFWHLSWWKKLLILAVLLAAVWAVKAYFFAAPPAPLFKTAEVKKGDLRAVTEQNKIFTSLTKDKARLSSDKEKLSSA